MGLETVKCPHCGYMYQMDQVKYKQEREAVISKGLLGRTKRKKFWIIHSGQHLRLHEIRWHEAAAGVDAIATGISSIVAITVTVILAA